MRAPLRSLKKLICRVRPGVRLAYASCVWRASALIALDLPEFERPANAISGAPSSGNCVIAAAAPSNFAPTRGPATRVCGGAGASLAACGDSVTIARFFMRRAGDGDGSSLPANEELHEHDFRLALRRRCRVRASG